MDLYKFPKDVLVKMLTTIEKETEEKTIKKCEENHIKELRYMLILVSNKSVRFEQCDYENCEYFYISKNDYDSSVLYKYKDIPFYECVRCHRSFCENHKAETSNFNETLYICNQCCRNGVM